MLSTCEKAPVMVCKRDVMALGFTESYSASIIRKAKALMVQKGYGFYSSRKVGRVPASAVGEILGVDLTGAHDAEDSERL